MGKSKFRVVIFVLLVLAVFFGPLLLCTGSSLVLQTLEGLAKETFVGVIQDKYIKRYGESDYFHVVVKNLENETTEVFQNRDFIPTGKFRSADLQASLVIGRSYYFTVVGWRWPIFSAFRNIIKAVSIEK